MKTTRTRFSTLAALALLLVAAPPLGGTDAPGPGARPVGFRLRDVSPAPFRNRVVAHFTWSSSTGNLADLAQVEIRERLIPRTNCGHVVGGPGGPLQTLPIPFLNTYPVAGFQGSTWPGDDGWLLDGHGTYATTRPATLPGVPPIGVPFAVNVPGSWQFDQVFEWSPNGVDWFPLDGVTYEVDRRVRWTPMAFGLYQYFHVTTFRGESLAVDMGVGGAPIPIPCL